MENLQNLNQKVLVHLSTGVEYAVETNESKNTIVNSYISTFNRTRQVPSRETIGYQIIKDYLMFNEQRKPTKAMWDWK